MFVFVKTINLLLVYAKKTEMLTKIPATFYFFLEGGKDPFQSISKHINQRGKLGTPTQTVFLQTHHVRKRITDHTSIYSLGDSYGNSQSGPAGWKPPFSMADAPASQSGAGAGPATETRKPETLV